MSDRPRVLMASYFDWDAPLHLGSHNLAATFVKAGWDVAYVSAAVSPVQVFRDNREFRSSLRRFSFRGRRPYDHLWTFMPFALVTPHNVPLLRSRVVHRNWHRATVPNVVRTAHAHGFDEVDLLYLDTPLQLFWLDHVRRRASVARITDRNSGYIGSASQLAVMEEELIHSVDLVVHSGEALGHELRQRGVERLLYLPNGVDFGHFKNGDRSIPSDYEHLPRPIAVYVGSLDAWFDHETVDAVAEAMPHVSFVFIGPSSKAGTQLSDRPNVHVLGPRPFSELPRYLHNADVGLLPRNVRDRGDLVNAMHPLKLYEYMACGLPVVATRLHELERLGSPAVLCDGPAEFIGAIGKILAEPSDPHLRLEFAQRADWSKRLQSLLDATTALHT